MSREPDLFTGSEASPYERRPTVNANELCD